MIELFCGSATVSKAFRAKGFDTLSIDVRKRKGVCEPDIQADILNVKPLMLPHRPMFVWISLPCNVYSYASNGRHFVEGKPRSKEALAAIKIMLHTFSLLEAINPLYYMFENPRGNMRYSKDMLDWLVANDGMVKYLTYGSYGYSYPKPTNLFTNLHAFKPLSPVPYGRGYKAEVAMDHVSLTERYSVPPSFADQLATFVFDLTCRNTDELNPTP